MEVQECSGCQERAKRKLSTPSRGRAGVWNEASSPKDSSNSKGTGRGQKLGLWVKVCQAQKRVNIFWNGYGVPSLEQDLQGVYMQSQAPSTGHGQSCPWSGQQVKWKY